MKILRRCKRWNWPRDGCSKRRAIPGSVLPRTRSGFTILVATAPEPRPAAAPLPLNRLGLAPYFAPTRVNTLNRFPSFISTPCIKARVPRERPSRIRFKKLASIRAEISTRSNVTLIHLMNQVVDQSLFEIASLHPV